MIKINLALRKQPVSAAGDAKAAKGLPKFDVESLKELPIRQMLVPVAVAVAATYYLDDMKTTELQKWDAEISKNEEQQRRLEAELAKTRGYEAIKQQLEADEYVIKSKIEVIQKLMAERHIAPQILLTLSTSIPEEVWLTNFELTETSVEIKGISNGYNLVSDFIGSLNETAFVKDVSFRNTKQETDPGGFELTSFELTAKRR